MPPSDTGAPAGWEVLVIPVAAAGNRLDRWLASELPGEISRSRIRAMIEAGEVLYDGRTASPSLRLTPGGHVAWQPPDHEPDEPQPELIALEILHEDAHIIVINKPAGLVVHPGAGNRSGTLVNALLHHCDGKLSRAGGQDRPGIVHRIDKDTSGIIVAVKTDEAHRELAAAFADHGRSGDLERSYLALVWGGPNPRQGKIDALLGRAPDRVRRAVVPEGSADARTALTRYAVLEDYAPKVDASLLQCRLETGRTHQIRVHLTHIGHPVIGDPLYGRGFASKVRALPEPARTLAENFSRQALHAAVLGFRHPVSGEPMRFETPLPHDMQELVNSFRNN